MVKSDSFVFRSKAMSHEAADALRFLREIDDLLDSGEYDWAEETLSGIRTTVERTERATEGQRRAVDNIANRGR